VSQQEVGPARQLRWDEQTFQPRGAKCGCEHASASARESGARRTCRGASLVTDYADLIFESLPLLGELELGERRSTRTMAMFLVCCHTDGATHPADVSYIQA